MRPGVTTDVEFKTAICVAAEAINDAWGHVQDFSVNPQRAGRLVRADYRIFLAGWLRRLTWDTLC